jgi:hypothetical protein
VRVRGEAHTAASPRPPNTSNTRVARSRSLQKGKCACRASFQGRSLSRRAQTLIDGFATNHCIESSLFGFVCVCVCVMCVCVCVCVSGGQECVCGFLRG